MAKKKPQLDEFLDEKPAEMPEPEPPVEPDSEPLPPDEPVYDEPEPVPPPAPESQSAASEWTPPAGCVVGDDPEGARPFKIRVGGQLYRHVSNAPDGNWVYEPDV